jgi:hypothetical protein
MAVAHARGKVKAKKEEGKSKKEEGGCRIRVSWLLSHLV